MFAHGELPAALYLLYWGYFLPLLSLKEGLFTQSGNHSASWGWLITVVIYCHGLYLSRSVYGKQQMWPPYSIKSHPSIPKRCKNEIQFQLALFTFHFSALYQRFVMLLTEFLFYPLLYSGCILVYYVSSVCLCSDILLTISTEVSNFILKDFKYYTSIIIWNTLLRVWFIWYKCHIPKIFRLTVNSWWDLASDSDFSFRFSFSGIAFTFLRESATIMANFVLSDSDDSWPKWCQFQYFF